jgi:hypothetical protein
MDLLRVTPKIEVTSDQVQGNTPWLAQLVVLFAYRRSVLIDRRRQLVLVTTRWLWFWKVTRTIPFERVSRIIYRAQGLPSLSPMRYVSLGSWDWYDSAFFLISIGIKGAVDDRHTRDELTLFSVWQQQPRQPDWLDKLAGVRENAYSIGDESAGAIVKVLREYLGVPVASH